MRPPFVSSIPGNHFHRPHPTKARAILVSSSVTGHLQLGHSGKHGASFRVVVKDKVQVVNDEPSTTNAEATANEVLPGDRVWNVFAHCSGLFRHPELLPPVGSDNAKPMLGCEAYRFRGLAFLATFDNNRNFVSHPSPPQSWPHPACAASSVPTVRALALRASR